MQDANVFINILTQCECLENLKLFFHFNLGTWQQHYTSSSDPAFDDAEAIILGLMAKKKGTPLKKVRLDLCYGTTPKGWQSISEDPGHWDGWSKYRQFDSRMTNEGFPEVFVSTGEPRFQPVDPDQESED